MGPVTNTTCGALDILSDAAPGPLDALQDLEAAMAVLSQLSNLELFLLTTPDDTEEAPWMVMAGLQTREVDVLLDILRLHVQRLGLLWYLESYLLVTMPRPGSRRLLGAAPDLVMALSHDQPRSSWDIVTEGQPPRWVLEVSSSASWERDSEEKPRIYQAMGVAEYVVFAPERHDGGPRLFGYRRDVGGQYQAWDVDAQGVLWSQQLELGLYVEGELWLRARDRHGNRLPTPTEWARAEAAARTDEAAARSEERARREAAEAAKDAAEADNARLREELRKLRERKG
jgi:Uma2 family endonuclease